MVIKEVIEIQNAQPKDKLLLDIDSAQSLLNRVNGFPVIQESIPESGEEYRRILYLTPTTDGGELEIEVEKYKNGWQYLALWKKDAGKFSAYLSIPLRVRNNFYVSQTFPTRVLEWLQVLEPGVEPKVWMKKLPK